MVAGLVVLTPFLSGCRQETEYPNQPILLICPWSAGGGTDRVSRRVARDLEENLGVPVNVINATGGGGVTGHTRGALARPDGYTLTMATVELNMLHWRGMTPITYEDFRPGVLLNRDAAALFVRADSQWETAGELANYIRGHPGELHSSGTARGGIWHLAFAGWLTDLGSSPDAVPWVSLNGAAPSLNELMAGGVDVVCCSLPEAKPRLDSGKVRCLGVMSDERLPQFPKVPTLKEQGIDWSMGGWRGVAMPAGTPEPIAEKVTTALTEVVKSQDFRDFMRTQGFNWSYMGPQRFEEYLKRMDKKFGELLTSEAFQESMAQHPVGPMFFPGLLGIVAAIVIVALALTGTLRLDPDAPRPNRRSVIRLIEIIVWVPLYILLAEWIGFLLTAVLLLLYLFWRLGAPWRVSLPVTLLLVVAAYQIFAISLRVPLPRGWLGW